MPEPQQQQPLPPLRGGTITRIAPQRDPSRVSIYLDGDFALGLSAQIAEERGLRTGQVLSVNGGIQRT